MSFAIYNSWLSYKGKRKKYVFKLRIRESTSFWEPEHIPQLENIYLVRTKVFIFDFKCLRKAYSFNYCYCSNLRNLVETICFAFYCLPVPRKLETAAWKDNKVYVSKVVVSFRKILTLQTRVYANLETFRCLYSYSALFSIIIW